MSRRQMETKGKAFCGDITHLTLFPPATAVLLRPWAIGDKRAERKGIAKC
jgi:hypothetical protein